MDSSTYHYENAHTFAYSPATIDEIHDVSGAWETMTGAIKNLPANADGNSLDDLAFLAGNVVSQGSAQAVTGDNITINADMAQQALTKADKIREDTAGALKDSKIELLRDYKTNLVLNASSQSGTQYTINFDGNLGQLNFDSYTVRTPYASVTVDRDYMSGETLVIQGLNARQLSAANAGGGNLGSGAVNIIGLFWGVIPLILVLAVWIARADVRRLLKVWMLPVICFSILFINMITAVITYQHSSKEVANVSAFNSSDKIIALDINMSKPIPIHISMLPNNGDVNYISFYNERNELQYSKYNPMTGMIDGEISQNGVYTLVENQVSFEDIAKKAQPVQDAIIELASRGIMSGTTDDMFYPDKMITRAEFTSAVLHAFNLMDAKAVSTFSDVKPTDWYYSVAATAQETGTLVGFDDNTFRADMTIPKDQMIEVVANTMIQQLAYQKPSNVNSVFKQFRDSAEIPSWSMEGIALAAQTGVLIYRTDMNFAPDDPMTRGDAAVVLYDMYNKIW